MDLEDKFLDEVEEKINMLGLLKVIVENLNLLKSEIIMCFHTEKFDQLNWEVLERLTFCLLTLMDILDKKRSEK